MIKKSKLRSVLCSIIFVILLIVCTLSGCLATYDSSRKWVIDTINKNYYFGELDDDCSDMSIREIVDNYLDVYSAYYTRSEYKAVAASNAGSKKGVGIGWYFVPGSGVFISTVVGNSPAFRAGMVEGEWLSAGSVDGGERVEFTSQAAFQNFVVDIADETPFTLYSADGANSYTVSKTDYTASYVYLCTNATAWIFGDSADGGLTKYERPERKMSALPDGAGYIRLDQFFGKAAEEFSLMVEKFNELNCTTLILDLRSNGGGYVDVMQSISGAFSDGQKKLAMLASYKTGKSDEFYCKRESNAARRIDKSVEVYVLANSGTASASEALIGTMHCYGALPYENIFLSDYSQSYLDFLSSYGEQVKNARTYGKGIMQSSFVNNKTGEVLKLTTAKIYWPDEVTSIHDRGVTTEDGCVAIPAAWEHTKGDEELIAALQIIAARQQSKLPQAA